MDKCILQHSTLPITITCEYTFEYHPGLPTNESSSIPTKIDGVLFANRFFLPKEDFNNEVKRDDFIVKCVHQGKKDDFFNSLPTKIKDNTDLASSIDDKMEEFTQLLRKENPTTPEEVEGLINKFICNL